MNYQKPAFRRSFREFALGTLFALYSPSLLAQAQPASSTPSASTWPALRDIATTGRRQFVSDHIGTFNGNKIRYRATLGEMILADASGKPATSVFNTAFVATGPGSGAHRPVVFLFNGGPGGASNALLFGAFGPKRMVKFDTAAQAEPATPILDNIYSILDVADLVFIDPPETGYGRTLEGADPKTFRSVDGDSYGVGQAIIRWLTLNGRIGSPKYLVGESYGTLRQVALVRDLAVATPKVTFDGIVMISQAITYNGPSGVGVIRRLPDPVWPIVRFQDAAAVAWYHGKIDNKVQTVAQAVAKAATFARTEYAEALLLGNRLDAAGRKRIAGRMEELTGIAASAYLANDLRPVDVRKELLRTEGKELGQFDGRETEPAGVHASDRERDWDAAFLGLTEHMMAYTSRNLKARGLGRYRSVVPDPYGFEDTWKYVQPPSPGLDIVLAEQLKTQPQLRVMMPMGWFDTTSSGGATEHLVSQLDVQPNRVRITYYPGGHMLYSDVAGLKAFTTDVRAFLEKPSMAPGQK